MLLSPDVGGGGVTHPVLDGVRGYPVQSQVWMGYPPGPEMGYPPSRPGMGYTPSRPEMGYPPHLDLGWGYPHPDLGLGTPFPHQLDEVPLPSEPGMASPHLDLGWGTPHLSGAGMGYTPSAG